VSPTFRAAATAGIAAFISALVLGVVIYGILFWPYSPALKTAAIALCMGLASYVVAFVAVWALVRSRYPHKRPFVGAKRGAAVGLGVLIFITVGHAVLSSSPAGVLYNVFAQLFYTLLGVGWLAAVLGWFGGKYIERRIFGGDSI
jgi:hypothetical protein